MRSRRPWEVDVAIALGAAHFALFVIVAAYRLTYAFDVEWMEGGMLVHAVRLFEGKPIYARPSTEFAAFFYTPLYPAVVSWLARVLGGVTYALGRGVSVASTLVAMGLVGMVVRREAGIRYALLAVGTYAALDRFAGTFSTVARPDALALTLGLASAVCARYGKGHPSAVVSALLAVLALYTKQTMVIVGAAVGLWLLATQRRRGVLFSAVAVTISSVAAAVMERASGGWFSFYVFAGHRSHEFYWANAFLFFWRDVLFLAPLLLLLPLAWGRTRFPRSAIVALLGLHLGVAFVQRLFTLDYPPHMYFRELAYESPRVLLLVPPLLMAGLLLLRQPPRDASASGFRLDSFWLWMFGASLAASAVGHSTQWAYKNAFLPAALFGSLFVALAAREMATHGRPYRLAVAAAFVVQFIALVDRPSSRLPGADDRARAFALRERLALVDGPVLAMAHPFIAYEHDGRTQMHQMSLSDVARLGGVQDFDAKIAAHAWSAILTDEGDGLAPREVIRRFYRPAETLDGPWMKTGMRVHPAVLWVPR